MNSSISALARREVYSWARLGSLPRRGWRLAWVEDIEEPWHECEACGFPSVRYVHHLHHYDVLRRIAVGCVCAGHLTGDYSAHDDAERLLRNRASRLSWLLDLDRWHPTRAGNLRITYRKNRLVLYRSRYTDGWRINVGERLGRIDHESESAAIRAAARFIDPPVIKGTPS